MARSNFQPLRSEDSHSSRVQDAVSAQLRALTNAVAATPLMGAPPPAWVVPTLGLGWVTLVSSGAGLVPAPASYHRDALGYVHVRGLLQNAAGAAVGALLWTMPVGYRPLYTQFFPGSTSGAIAFLRVDPNGQVLTQTVVAAGASLTFSFIYLAEV